MGIDNTRYDTIHRDNIHLTIRDYLSDGISIKWAFLAVIFALAILLLQPKRPRIKGAPLHGSKGWWEPSWLLSIRFIYDAYNIIDTGYQNFKNQPFIVRRLDTDIHVLPMKYLDELRLLPRNDLNGKMVHYNNLFRSWPWASVIRDSDLHVTVLTRKLNPDVAKYLDMAYEEFKYGWDLDVPQPEEWTTVDIQQSMRMLVARMSARVFVGDPTCRDPTWLGLTLNFSMDLFLAGFTLRMFPLWMRSFVKPFIPARWRVQKQIDIGTEVVREFMAKREEDARAGNKETEDTLFEWMMEHAVGKEGTLDQMAARQCILTLASIHTTATTVANVLFDMIEYPEWFSVLRNEIDDTIKRHGELGQNMPIKTWLEYLEKMDSFILESQRMNPPILLTPQRIAMMPITLKDGTHIPKDVRIAWAGPAHAFDPSINPEPQKFDPMRSYRKRHSGGGENLKKFMVGQTDPDNMSFGYGNQVCPGRYFAVGEIKLVLVRLLQEFDFASAGGTGRPRNLHFDENVILDPQAKVQMKRREVAV
ncbi:cytochrome P450 [Periconia macrospinosa]|uniref:Cytochrome P450 n=1 Tax=Periconia macrospinosa TaxID=97972 RepID=A0A2V1E7V5_9PLEO|nr:cytochrome P450 [Periconia macrospinosa]